MDKPIVIYPIQWITTYSAIKRNGLRIDITTGTKLTKITLN